MGEVSQTVWGNVAGFVVHFAVNSGTSKYFPSIPAARQKLTLVLLRGCFRQQDWHVVVCIAGGVRGCDEVVQYMGVLVACVWPALNHRYRSTLTTEAVG